MLKPTSVIGTVEAVLINENLNSGLDTQRIDKTAVNYEGFVGDGHSGLTRRSCVRVTRQYPKGTEIRNVRQITIVSTEELKLIAEKMGIEKIEPEWLGANLLITGIPELTFLPPSSRLIFNNGTSLVVDMENGPCKYPGEIIDRHYPNYGKHFAKAALTLRGVTAWVECEGSISQGDQANLHIPRQRIYKL